MGENVSFPVDGGTADGYLARPADGNGPGVLVLPAWWGLVGQIKSVADRLAGEGFVALAPDLYRGAVATGADEAQRLAAELPADRVAGDLVGAARYLAATVEGKVGAVGFGLGGSLALWAASLTDDVVAAGAFYPLVPWHPAQPDWSAFGGTAAVVHAADEDSATTGPELDVARKAVETVGGELTIHEYPGTKRGFYNDDRTESYDPHASATAWARTLELFRSRL
ncbi:dienelactone hydrolase family protein [Cryptosporangium aurantiacum]|uniref:Carboxymethylenebutenolidase n=1 Tax=Cryptosporangium aurantiacum TaxID=134849 RepID=A0A1M7RJ58_9ACTN|nr:dienelactone hydrolase family protein [Cryptosporangium aurantiacum]SHN46333.1 carboxymethylenebutenolidase [Cryptosporangium aurantiacum]